MVASDRSTLRHLPALDGLRGLAVLAVLLFHTDGALRGGYLGVDLFFVLSGFLITSLLLAEHRASETISMRRFWLRRALRLFPALLALIAAIAAYSFLIATPDEVGGLRDDAFATLAYVANWHTILAHTNYWDLFARPSLLEHTWSLSIEEQFYVVWPLLALVCLRRGGRRALTVATLALGALSVAAMLARFDPARTSRAYLGTDTRASGILAGAALACVLPAQHAFKPSTVRVLDAVGLLAAVSLGIAWWRLDGQSRFLYRGGFWLTELAALALIVCGTAGRHSLVARALSIRPLTAIGTISYGVYLWHWPIDVVLTAHRVHVTGFRLQAIRWLVTLIAALLSYRFVERPFRTRGVPFARPLAFFAGAFACVAMLVFHATYPHLIFLSAMHPSVSNVRHRILVFGDSTASSLYWPMIDNRPPSVDVDLLARDGCAMLLDNCDGERWPQQSMEHRSNANLLIIAGSYLHDLREDGVWHHACAPHWDRDFEIHLAHRLADLAHAPGRVWVTSVPYATDRYASSGNRDQVDCINRAIRSAVASVPGVRIMDLATYLCPGGRCRETYNGELIRNDGVHYTMRGGADVARWMIAQTQR